MPVTEFTKATHPVTFASRALKQRVVMEAGHPMRNSWGDKIGDTVGHTLEFVDGRYVAESVEEIEYLRGRINTPGGPEIWELGKTHAPDSKATIQQIAALAAKGDTAELHRLRSQEMSEWQRQDVLDTLDAVLEVHGEPVEDEPAPAPEPAAATVVEPKDPEPENAAVAAMADVPWPQLKQFAAQQGVKTHKKSREEIEAELAALTPSGVQG